MSRPIHYQARYSVRADEVFRTLVDRAYLEARLTRIGGRNACLMELTTNGDFASYVTRQGVGREHLPGMVQRLFSGDLMIERAEQWRRAAPGRYAGTVRASVTDAPGQIEGELRLADAGDGAEFALDGTATITLPLFGGKVEGIVADYIAKLVAMETKFTQEWLDG
jgi:uncharacterized protein DUF2505